MSTENKRLKPEEPSRAQIWQMFVDNLQAWKLFLRETPPWLLWIRALPRKFREAARNLLEDLREAHFPESEYRIVQLFLLAAGMLPMLGCTVRERLLTRRKKRTDRHGRLLTWWESIRIHPVKFLAGAVICAGLAVLLSLYTIGTQVSYDGTVLGTTDSNRKVRAATADLEEISRTALQDESYTINRDQLTTHPKVLARRDLISQEELEQELEGCLGDVAYGYTLYVNEEPVGSTTFPGALEELLEQTKLGYVSEATVESYFEEEVEVREGYAPAKYFTNLGYIAEKLNATKEGAVTYTVVKGDSWSKIAKEHGLTISQLQSMNAGYNAGSLHGGDELTISNAVPFLTVVNVERQNYIADVGYSVEYKDDPTMFKGEYKVLSKGVFGSADVTANVTFINGEEIKRETVASVTLKQPVAEKQARGTKDKPSWYPTGTFQWPCRGPVLSGFGYRNTGIPGATTNHKGIDIAVPTGTAICAADGGTVIYSGWYSTYGYLVKIQHNNGFVTYYAHNSRLLVSVGEHVYKGQKIAAAGMTGVASGPHCHFGVELNGTFVNPRNYLP